MITPRLFLACIGMLTAVHAAPQPNIIFILCDDLGFGDTGPSFQNDRAARNDRSIPAFATPQLDRFAAEGVQLRNHYCGAPVCAPSRASILLGRTQGHANVRDNQFDKALENNHTMATVLKQAGYATAAIGKWGLQGPGDRPRTPGPTEKKVGGGSPATWPAYPTKRGFDFYFGYVRHVDGHFHYPKEDEREVWDNDRNISASLDLCYTTDLFAARAKKWIVDQRATKPEQPFFLYLAFDTPHAVLALPPCPFPSGGGMKGGLQWTGRPGAMINTATGKMDGWMDPAVSSATWDHDKNPATPEMPWPEVQKRYATDVRRIDAAVGDLLQLLKDLKVDDNTLVVFTSDNGPSRESYLKDKPYEPEFFAGYGPFDGIKRDTLEGGVREPTLVRWPAQIRGARIDRTPSGQWDWLATFAEAAGVVPPAASDGVSLLPTLTGQGEQFRSALYIEYFNGQRTPSYEAFVPAHRGKVRQQMQTVLVDRFVGVRYNIKSAEDDFEIFDVEKDPQQSHNLAGEAGMADVQRRLKARALQSRRPDPDAPRPYDEALVPPVMAEAVQKGKIQYKIYEGEWAWVPQFRTLAAKDTGLTDKISAGVCPPNSPGGGASFDGLFQAPADGEYTFVATSDGGAEVFLHDCRVIDDDFARTGTPATGTIRLAAGWHPLRVYYRHGKDARQLSLEYSGPGIPRQVVPSSALAASR
jgi:arylsulfatase A-like enzyme